MPTDPTQTQTDIPIPNSDDPPGPKSCCQPWVLSVVLVVVCLIVFHQLPLSDFVSIDDPIHVAGNAHVRAGLTRSGFNWAFTTCQSGHWHPLTWLSYMLDCQIFGVDPGVHHLVNLLLHIAGTIVLFLVWNRMTSRMWAAAFVAAAFALHPLHVETVAWISQRNNVLSAFFWMLTLAAYVRYVHRPSRTNQALLVLPFALGLLAKSMLVTLPFVLLLLDYWPLGRLRVWTSLDANGPQPAPANHTPTGTLSLFDLIKEKFPLFALAAVSCIITYLAARQSGATVDLVELPLPARLANAVVTYGVYFRQTIWPRGLICFYPHPPGGIPFWHWFTSAALLLAALLGLIASARRRPWLLVGGLWYLGTLLPVIGIVKIGPQAFADRYTYIPLIGLFIIIAHQSPRLTKLPFVRPPLLAAAAIAILIAWGTASFFQTRHWSNTNALFTHAVAVSPDNPMARNHLGVDLLQRQEVDRAIEQFQEEIRLRPNHCRAYNNLGVAFVRKGKTTEALASFRRGLDAESNYTSHLHIGTVLAQRGQLTQAITHYQQALEIAPRIPFVHFVLGNTLAQQNRFDEALEHWTRALDLDPTFRPARDRIAATRLRTPPAP